MLNASSVHRRSPDRQIRRHKFRFVGNLYTCHAAVAKWYATVLGTIRFFLAFRRKIVKKIFMFFLPESCIWKLGRICFVRYLFFPACVINKHANIKPKTIVFDFFPPKNIIGNTFLCIDFKMPLIRNSFFKAKKNQVTLFVRWISFDTVEGVC